MELSFTKLDLEVAKARGHMKNLGDTIRRGHASELWYVPFTPVNFKDPLDWRTYRKEDHIFIPVYPYLVPNRPTDALGFAFQLGIRAMHDLGGRPIKRFHLALGEPVEQIVNTVTNEVQWKFWMGFGVVLNPVT